MSELLAVLERLGRVGALIALTVGLAFIAGGAWVFLTVGPLSDGGVWSPRATLFGTGAGFLGVLFSLYSVTLFRTPPRPKKPKPGVEEFQRAAGQMRRPFFACVECRLLYSNTECAGTCSNCGSTADCMEVTGDAEMKLLLATLGDAK